MLDKLPPIARDHSRPLEERVNALIAEMTLEEKLPQLLHDAPAIERLGIPAYNWWNETSHGVARAGVATVFPHAIAHGATFNLDLVYRLGVAVADEARAKHHEAFRQEGRTRDYYGLTTWTPNINIFRDPRWGRGQETYGEDPFLMGKMAVAYIKALQGDDPRYYKLAACAKHFAVHSGPEGLRHEFDAYANDHDLWDTYLPAFEMCVREGKVESIMGAYNRTNGEPCCASPTLLQKILRDQWGFKGHVVSDCGAIEDIHERHKVVNTAAEAAALALNNGCDLICGCIYDGLVSAVEEGLISEETINLALRRLFTARFRLGMFDPPEIVPYANIPYSVNDSPEHNELATEVALEGIVLLKNQDSFLPLDKSIRSVAVIGPNADDVEVMLGNYHGIPSNPITILEGIRRMLPHAAVTYAKGCHIAMEDESGFAQALAAAQQSEVIIFVGGLNQLLEGEDLQDEGVPPGMRSQGDRVSIDLPPVQERLLQALHKTGKPVVLIILSGSAVTVNWADLHLPAILQAWYPGQNGGTAVAAVLFGDYNPAGRLPVTVHRSVDDLSPFEDYDMRGRTYRYCQKPVLYPFGHGLSYTDFTYHNLHLSHTKLHCHETICIEVDVTNTGIRAGDEVVQVYLDVPQPDPFGKVRQLVAFKRIHLNPQSSEHLIFELSGQAFQQVNEEGNRLFVEGQYQLSVGGGQPGESFAVIQSPIELV
jgi:beta-glucosidase